MNKKKNPVFSESCDVLQLHPTKNQLRKKKGGKSCETRTRIGAVLRLSAVAFGGWAMGGGGRRVRNSSAGVVLRGSSVVAAVLEGRAKIVVVLSHLGQKWFGYGINTTKIPVFRVSIR